MNAAALLPDAPKMGANVIHIRPVSLTVFEHERAKVPYRSGTRPWSEVVTMHQQRAVRQEKPGFMLGGYRLNGCRSNANVVSRSIIQLDIDSDVERNATTGNVTRLVRQAPPFDQVRRNIDQFEWVAASSHSHDPARGIIKYRITIYPDRDIVRDEHEPVLEALDELLGRCLDRNAWAWSQAFYLPSCPPDQLTSAFSAHNPGNPLPVDTFVTRGREILTGGRRIVKKTDRENPVIAETAENVDIVRDMLSAIPADVERNTWRNVVWGVQALSWSRGEEIARDWSMTALHKYDAAGFDGVWSNFDPTRPDAVRPGVLEHVARQHGYTGARLQAATQFDGRGFDVANGKAFAAMHRDRLLYVMGAERWYEFEAGFGWSATKAAEADSAAKLVLEGLKRDRTIQLTNGADEARIKQLGRHIEYSSRAASIRSMSDMAKSEPGMSVSLGDFDKDPWLAGVQNGVVDLRAGKLRPADPRLLVSKRCAVDFDPSATCPRFEKFLEEIQPDPVIREFLQRYCCYLLTGDVSEQGFAFLYGGGSNGKSVFVETLAWLLGDYSTKISTELLMDHKRNPQAPSPDIVALKGARLAFASETEEGHRLSSSRVKELTGGDTLTGRLPYAKSAVSFVPTHKLLMVGNYKPEISDMSHGMWRRVILIGFNQTIPEGQRDQRLLGKLKGEGSGVLNWALAGAANWRRDGLKIPPSIAQATDAYRDEQDIIGEWLNDRCFRERGAATSKADIYFAYTSWATANGHQPLAQVRLTRRLNDRGYKLDAGRRKIVGLGLKGAIGGAAA